MTKNVNLGSFLSLDVECNGLPYKENEGIPYAVSIQVYRKGVLKERICLSCEITDEVHGELDSWLQQNPHLLTVEGSEVLSYVEMMQRAAEFYLYNSCRNDDGEIITNSWNDSPNHQTLPVLYHCGMVVEGNFFRQLSKMGLIGQLDAPMCPIEVGNYLRMAGEDPHSVDTYIEKFGLHRAEGQQHNPDFDAAQAATAYLHLVGIL